MLHKMSVDDWDAVMNVHLRGAFLMSRALQPYMREAEWGRIVNLSSTSALGNRGQANYSAAKAGMQGLTKTLAIELGRFNVTANAIAPGFIQTDMTAATAERIGLAFDEFVTMAAQQIPVGRVGQPRTSPTQSPSWSAKVPASCPVRSSMSQAGPRTDEGFPRTRGTIRSGRRAPRPQFLASDHAGPDRRVRAGHRR